MVAYVPPLPRWLTSLLAPFDSERRSRQPFPAEREDRIEWGRLLPFFAMHAGCLAVLWVGVSPIAVAVAAALYLARMFAITAFLHRCFAHRSFATHRVMRFLGALVATSSAQRGPLWWVAHHRRHHLESDRDGDAHSPLRRGFWWSHLFWFMTRRNYRTDHARVPELTLVPELRLLDRFDLLVPLGLAALLFGAGEVLAVSAPSLGTDGMQMLVWGFCVSTTALFHATSAVNSLGHTLGSRPFPTRDGSRNSFWLALLTLGEGWHNNHHWHPASARQGFHWWQVDLTYYLLQMLAACGVVWDLRPVPARARAAEGRVA
ncbi:MAG: acyl-CoA desaturase [Planctomycetes bacterium]|nr:acyl-CoA desaturase [Planctomycetota bacterium]MCB9870166.1 acyl-CoA desaturase [Planctomycetota bacterium]